MSEQGVNLIDLVKHNIAATRKSVREISDAIAGAASANLSHGFHGAELRDDIVNAARGVVDGAAAVAMDLTRDVAETVSVTAAAAIEAAKKIDAQTAQQVTRAVNHAGGGHNRRAAEPDGGSETASAP